MTRFFTIMRAKNSYLPESRNTWAWLINIVDDKRIRSRVVIILFYNNNNKQVHSLSRSRTCTDSQSPERVAYLWTTDYKLTAAARDAPPTKIIIIKQNKKSAEALLLFTDDVLRIDMGERRMLWNTYDTL